MKKLISNYKLLIFVWRTEMEANLKKLREEVAALSEDKQSALQMEKNAAKEKLTKQVGLVG